MDIVQQMTTHDNLLINSTVYGPVTLDPKAVQLAGPFVQNAV